MLVDSRATASLAQRENHRVYDPQTQTNRAGGASPDDRPIIAAAKHNNNIGPAVPQTAQMRVMLYNQLGFSADRA